MKKGLIFGLAAVLSAAFLVAGCSQATDGTTTTVGLNSIYGTVTAAILQARIDAAIAGGETIILEDKLVIGAGVVDFKTARVHVNGTVTYTDTSAAVNVTINAANAAVTWADDGEFVSGNFGVYIYNNENDIIRPDNTRRISATAGVQLVDSLSAIIATATKAAVRNFTFGPVADYDYSTTPPVPVRINATGLTNLYVLGVLTVPANGVPPTALTSINALGTVDVVGTDNDVLSSTKVVMTAPATLTSSEIGGAVITLPGTTTSLPNVRVESGKNITVKIAATGTFAIPGTLNGPGTLIVDPQAPITGITIGGGNGNVEFTSASTITTTAVVTISSTGTTTFNNSVTLNYGATDISVIAGDVVFKDNFVRTDGVLDLRGDVTLYNGKTITLTTTDTVTLATGKKIIVGGGLVTGGTGETVPLTPVLEALAVTVLAPATGAILEAPAPYSSTATADDIAASKNIGLNTADLNIGKGALQVVSGSIFAINAVTLSTTGVAPGVTGSLSLAPGGRVDLADDNSVIDFGTVAGEATITGDNSSLTFLTADGAAVTLGDDTITGAASGASLALGIDTGGVVGTNDAVITTADSKNLTLDRVTLDLSGTGKVLVPDTGSVTLVNQAALFLAEDGSPNTYGYIKYGTFFARIGGGERVALGAVEQTDTVTLININSIAHSSGGGVTIQADGTNPLTFVKGAAVPQFSKTNS